MQKEAEDAVDHTKVRREAINRGGRRMVMGQTWIEKAVGRNLKEFSGDFKTKGKRGSSKKELMRRGNKLDFSN